MVMTSYQPKALPIDDDGFVRSFALGDDHQLCEEGLAFFAQQGFVVVNSVRWSALHATREHGRSEVASACHKVGRAQPLGGQVDDSS